MTAIEIVRAQKMKNYNMIFGATHLTSVIDILVVILKEILTARSAMTAMMTLSWMVVVIARVLRLHACNHGNRLVLYAFIQTVWYRQCMICESVYLLTSVSNCCHTT